MIKRLVILAAVVFVLVGTLMLFTFNVIRIERISFMEVQPSFRPMEDPLPIPPLSIPVEGAAFVLGMGAPVNPIEADEISLQRGELLYGVNCAVCHGVSGQANGPITPFLAKKKPADHSSDVVQTKSDGALFMVISYGVPGSMPALNENLNVRERWDVVNYMRTLAP